MCDERGILGQWGEGGEKRRGIVDNIFNIEPKKGGESSEERALEGIERDMLILLFTNTYKKKSNNITLLAFFPQ